MVDARQIGVVVSGAPNGVERVKSCGLAGHETNSFATDREDAMVIPMRPWRADAVHLS